MKKILTLAFLFLSVFAFSQRQTTRYLTLNCNIQQIASSSGKPHISCNCNDQGGTFDSGDVAIGDTLVFNDGGVGYKLPIDSIVTPGVPTIVVRVDWTGLGLVLVPTGRGAISRGATSGLDGTIAGLTPGDNQYLEEDFVNNVGHVAGNYTFVTTDSFTTFTPSSPAPAVGDFILDGRRGSTWRKSGASAYTRVTLDNGNNVSSVYNVTNDTLSFNSNLYNHVRLSTGDSATAYVLAPDHIASQFVGELFVIGFGSGSNVVTVTWDTLYGTFALGNMPSVMIPANSIVNYTFRVVSEGGEGIRLQWIDGGQNTEVAFDSDRTVLRAISAGVNIGGTTVTDVLEYMYFTPPTITLNLSPTTTVYEVGTSNAITLSGATTNAGAATLSAGHLTQTAPSADTLKSFTSATSYADTISFTPQQGGSGQFNMLAYSFRATQAWVKGAESGTATSTTRSISGVYPVLYGMSATDFTSTGNPYTGLTKLVEAEGDKTVTLTGSGFIYFLVPKTWSDWALSSIIDHNGFNVTASFTASDINISSSGLTNNWTTVAYRMYKLNTTTTTSGNAYQFNR